MNVRRLHSRGDPENSRLRCAMSGRTNRFLITSECAARPQRTPACRDHYSEVRED